MKSKDPCYDCNGKKVFSGHPCYACMENKDWSKPFPLSKPEVVFPANALDFMPKEKDIPNEFWPGRGNETETSKKWLRFQNDCFYHGIKPSVQFYLKDGVDGPTAFDHLNAIQGSYAPRHQHKMAAFAYLCSLWFDDVVWEPHTSEELKAMKEEQLAKENNRSTAEAGSTTAEPVRPADGGDCCHITGAEPPRADAASGDDGPDPAA